MGYLTYGPERERDDGKFHGQRPYARRTSRSERERVGGDGRASWKKVQKSRVRRGILPPTDGTHAEIFSRAFKPDRRTLEENVRRGARGENKEEEKDGTREAEV